MTSSLLVFFVASSWAVSLANDITLTSAMQQTLLNLHNTARDAEPASNMQTMTWDASLASQAQEWADGCLFQHQTGQSWGENLAAKTYNSGNNVTSLLEDMFQLWMNEKSYNTGGTFEECCSMQSYDCCHYTQVIWAKSNKLGCGLTYCDPIQSGTYQAPRQLYLACYYSPRGNSPSYACTYDWSPYES